MSVSRLVLALLLVLPTQVLSQDILSLSKRPNPEQVATAKATIQAAQDAPVVMAFGGYVLIDIKLDGKLTNYTVPGSDDCLRTVSIPKGQGYTGWLVPKGKTQPEWTVIEPVATHDRLLVTGIMNGTATLLWMGVNNGEAVVVAAFKFLVGKQPDPVPPPDSLSDFEKALKKAMAADIAAGKGTKAHAELLAGIYRGVAASPPTSGTAGDLYNTMQKAIAAAGVPPPSQSLPSMRAMVATELNKKLPTETDKQLTLEDRNRITATFNAMADSLEASIK